LYLGNPYLPQVESIGESNYGNEIHCHEITNTFASTNNHVNKPADTFNRLHKVDHFKPHDKDGEALDSPEVRLNGTCCPKCCNADIEQTHDVRDVNVIPEI